MRAGLPAEERQVHGVGRAERDRGRQVAGAELLEQPDDLAPASLIQRAGDRTSDPADVDTRIRGGSEPLGQLHIERRSVLAAAQADVDGSSLLRGVHGPV